MTNAGETMQRLVKLAAPLAIVAVFAAGCGKDDNGNGAKDARTTTTAAATGAPAGVEGVDTAAADLRAGLTSLLQEHVYLAGAAISTAVSAGGDMKNPAVVSAVDTLDANSVALSKAIGSAYGADAAKQFLSLWRAHIGFFVDYTLGGATGDKAKQADAKAKLDQYRKDFGAFIESATGGAAGLDQDKVAADLQMHVNTLLQAIDAVLAKDPTVYAKLKEAADHMPMTADALAGSIDAQKKLEGDVDSPASALRTGLTALLQEHVYLAGLAINQAVADGGNLKAPATANAVAALDVNTVDLSKAVGSVYGADAAKQFLSLWRAHIGFFVDYTLGGATGDKAEQAGAKAKLDQYRKDFGAFVASATRGKLSADQVAEDLQMHVNTLIDAIDAVLAKDPSVFPKLREAAQHMPMTADALAGAIVASAPDKFAA
jgi:hypothetical protein